MSHTKKYFPYTDADGKSRKLDIQKANVAKFYTANHENTQLKGHWEDVLTARRNAAKATLKRTTDTFMACHFDLTEKAVDTMQDILVEMKNSLREMEDFALSDASTYLKLLSGDNFFGRAEQAEEVLATGRMVRHTRTAKA